MTTDQIRGLQALVNLYTAAESAAYLVEDFHLSDLLCERIASILDKYPQVEHDVSFVDKVADKMIPIMKGSIH